MFADLRWGDSRVQLNEEVKAYWLKKITSPKILQSSRILFKELGYKNN